MNSAVPSRVATADVVRELGRGSKLAWLPWPGRHRLELLDAKGKVLDSVRIEVRGAGALVEAPGSKR